MAGTNEMGSVEGQLVGLPLAGPETFSVQQLAYLKRALGLDETLLFNSATAATSGSFSEAITNFEKIRIYGNRTGYATTSNLPAYTEVYLRDGVPTNFMLSSALAGSNNTIYAPTMVYNLTSSAFSFAMGSILNMTANPSVSLSQSSIGVLRVVGIHRIAGGN